MAILSLEFLGFVLASLAGYYLLSALRLSRFWQNLFLLAASYYFYGTWFRWYPLLLLVLTLINFGMGHWLQKSTRRKRVVLWLGILINIGIMLWFLIGGKYLQNTLTITAANALDIMPLLILPVGMSFYVLNGISYLIDINLRLSKPTTNFVDFALYLAWFPRLISGPIERARKFLPILAERQVVDNQVIGDGLTLILVGLFRTAILGGLMTLFMPAVPMSAPQYYGNPVLLWALITYMFYLYNQFAGYTDIVRGVSSLYGIPLSRNFNAPFFSKDVSDFWTRWHISLSQWLRDYIYMPISRSFLRRNPSRTNIPNLILPPLVTMLVSGLWHGADWNHLVWGAMMGFLIVFENVRMLFRPVKAETVIPLWQKVITRLFLLVTMMVVTVPFVMDLHQSRVFYLQLIRGWDGVMFDLRPLLVIAASLLVDWFQHHSGDELVFRKWHVLWQIFFVAAIPLGTVILHQLQSAPPVFVYP